MFLSFPPTPSSYSLQLQFETTCYRPCPSPQFIIKFTPQSDSIKEVEPFGWLGHEVGLVNPSQVGLVASSRRPQGEILCLFHHVKTQWGWPSMDGKTGPHQTLHLLEPWLPASKTLRNVSKPPSLWFSVQPKWAKTAGLPRYLLLTLPSIISYSASWVCLLLSQLLHPSI